MSNLITQMREGVLAHLAQAFPKAEVVGGPREGVNQRDKTLIAVFWKEWPQLARDVQLATPPLTVRVFPPKSKLPKSENPRDPEPLEQAAYDLMVAMRGYDRFSDLAPGVAIALSRVFPVDQPDQWYVEAELQCITAHVAREAA